MEKSQCRVKCNVCECVHNDRCNCCSLDTIEITHDYQEGNLSTTPHFCKSFCEK